jgi:drug/metabolite transporter (DMT)-like permease
MVYFALIFSISTLCAGQILLKKSALLVSTLDHPLYLLLKPLFILALFSYGISMLSWIYVLQNMPLSRAYMFVSSAFIILPLLSCYFFGEQLNPRFFMGAALIICGVFLTLK